MQGLMNAFKLLHKEAGAALNVARGAVAAGKGFLGSGKHISKAMLEAGVESPVAHALAKASPYAMAAYGGKKVYESPTAQKLRYKYQVMKQKRQMRRAQRGGY